jgi:DNA-binding beta-propeller fold protein YncE
MNRNIRRLLICMLASSAWLALVGGAAAAPGQIAYEGCVANHNLEGCVDLPFSPLANARSVVVSPDDKSLYVASFGGDSIGHLFRGPEGELAWDGCLNNNGSENCGDLPGAPINEAFAVAASPDGKSVYVVSVAGDSIARFSRTGPDGQITYAGCLNNDGSQGCVDLPFAPLDGPSAVAVSPDGRSVYVTSYAADSVSHFFRGPDGALTWDGCLNNDGSENCGDVPETPIDGPDGVAVSPDSKSVYVASFNSDSISHLFSTGPQGQIAWDGCLNNDGSQNCGDVPGEPLHGASGVAVSPDGKSVYVASSLSDSIAHAFATGPQGQISWDGCLNNDGSENCGDLPGAPLDGARGVATSGDGRSVYVASEFSDSITHLLRSGPQGQVGYDSCAANDASDGCLDLAFDPLSGAHALAVSPDGKSVYVAAPLSSSVAHFSREVTPPGTPDPSGTPNPSGMPDPSDPSADIVAPSVSRLRLTNRRFRVGRAATAVLAGRVRVGTTFRYTLSEPAAVTVAFQRALRGRGPRRRAGTLSRTGQTGPNRLAFSGRIGRRKLRPGAYRAVVTATDSSGNRSRAAVVRFRIVAR